MSFTSDIKKEIISERERDEKKACAMLSAYVLTSGAIGKRGDDLTFFVVSETEYVAEYMMGLFELVFKEPLTVSRATKDKMSGRGKLVLEYLGDKKKEVEEKLYLSKLQQGQIPSEIEADEERSIAFIKGAFLGGGSCVLPELSTSGYHLQFSIPDGLFAEHFVSLLDGLELFARPMTWNYKSILYIKNKDGISDFLSVLGLENCYKKFIKFTEEKEKANRQNRTENCFSGNADKSAKASAEKVLEIKYLSDTGVLETLDADLNKTAKMRMDNPTMSLSELASEMKITKSCLNHRLRKLSEIYRNTRN